MTQQSSSGGEPAVPPGMTTGMTAGKEMPPGTLPGDQVPPGTRADMHPGDELPPGAPGAGENYCLACGGSGKTQDGAQCEQCGGTGKVIEGLAGG